jgi:anti-sigma factor (TIGR02949 family)
MRRIDRYTCDETFQRLDDYLDRELSPEEMRLVQEHLEVCAYCMLEFAFEANVLREVREKLTSVRVPEGLTSKVLGALAQAQDEMEAGGSGGQDPSGD